MTRCISEDRSLTYVSDWDLLDKALRQSMQFPVTLRVLMLWDSLLFNFEFELPLENWQQTIGCT